MISIRVNLGQRGYDIVVTTSDFHAMGRFARERSHATSAFLVTDDHAVVYAQSVAESLEDFGFRTATEVLPSGEAQKSLASASRLYDTLAELHADRRTLVVPVGGGVVGDLAGFVAATYARGLPLLMVPTTLLAMVDSSVGGKVAVNHPKAKNLIGAFHQPVGVWIDTATLETLPDREFQSGLAEVVKYGVILDAEFFALLEANVPAIKRRDAEILQTAIARCCRLKAGIVEQDEREETGLRMMLNYGHTFAHAFETVASYGRWLHGEAVAAGMMCAARLAERRGLISAELVQRQERILIDLTLPIAPGSGPAADLLSAMHSDKKAADGRLRFVLPRRLGAGTVVDDIAEDEVLEVLKQLPASPPA
jgi:3-dehydroquinate synthase